MTLEELLDELSAKKCGYYYLVTCPECGHREAYLYIDDIEKYQHKEISRIPIRCNRQNKCGITTYIDNLDNVSIDNIPKIEESDFVSEDAILKTGELIENNCRTCCYEEEFDWRGIPFSVLVNHQVVYLKNGWLKWMKECGENAFPERFTSNENYNKRNIVIPCYDYDGRIERVLLRDRKGEAFPKELTMVFQKESKPIWNKPILKQPGIEIIFVTEGVPDALSVYTYLEQRRGELLDIPGGSARDFFNNSPIIHTGVLALPGVKNWRKLLEEIVDTKSTNKKFVICFDNDAAGNTCYQDMERELKNRAILYDKFDLGEFKDMNDYLVGNKDAFFMELDSTMERIVRRKRKLKIPEKKTSLKPKTKHSQVKHVLKHKKVLKRAGYIGYHDTDINV